MPALQSKYELVCRPETRRSNGSKAWHRAKYSCSRPRHLNLPRPCNDLLLDSESRSLRFGIVHRPYRGLCRISLAGNLDLVGRRKNLFFALTLARHVPHADRIAQVMTVVPGRDGRNDFSVANQCLIVEEQRLGIAQSELKQSAFEPALPFAKNRVPPDEVAFVRLDRETKPGLKDVVLVGDIVTEMPEGLFDAARVEGVQSAQSSSRTPRPRPPRPRIRARPGRLKRTAPNRARRRR